MLFGRQRVPVEGALALQPRGRREAAREPRMVAESGMHVVPEVRWGEAPHGVDLRPALPALRLVPCGTFGDSYAGLDRLDREELDEG